MCTGMNEDFNRNYNMSIPFLDTQINIGIFCNTKTPDIMFTTDHNISETTQQLHGLKITSFTNIATSEFCDTFIKLNNYEQEKLSIVNQFSGIKDEYRYLNELHYIFNEDIKFCKHQFSPNHSTFDQFMVFGFGFNSMEGEYIYMIAERQCISTNIKKKIVRTIGLQIATSKSIEYLRNRKN